VNNPLFVYGTLKSGSNHEFAVRLRQASEFISAGRVQGSLYRIAHYPGWVEDSSGGWVTGEIWRPHEPDALLAMLDEYEGREYTRVIRHIDTAGSAGDGSLECWVYLYSASIEGKEQIISGNWPVGS
jgi:gamma-glutamylcyclotransferase (GGCT)/AIG2-like uncharacterized protein YtfP